MKVKKFFKKTGNVLTFGTGFNPILYKPEKHSITKEVAGGMEYKKMFNAKGLKELVDTLYEANAKHSFKRSMEKEGLTEEDLKRGHKSYQLGMFLMMLATLVPLYNLFSFSFNLPILEMLFKGLIVIVMTSFIMIFYLKFAWQAFNIRNKTIYGPFEFLKLCMIDKSNLSPIEEYTAKAIDKPKIRQAYNIQNNNKERKNESK